MRQRTKICYVETQSQKSYLCHVAPQAINVWYFQAMATWLYESYSSALESAKFKFELANEVAVLESAKFELCNDKGLAWNHYFLPT